VPAASPPAARVAIALGSNLGDRRAQLDRAIDALRPVVSDMRVSAIAETAPHDVPGPQPPYLNAVLIGCTTLAPRALLDRLLAIEAAAGRTRPGPKAARTLDLDLILYDGRVIDGPGLTVPHPRFRTRPFVLGPLAALAPRWRDPVTGRTLAALWREAGGGR
jgi:2-amino-4-hydroxy-6-hydroxymethyldihydropteridine diphosphokinase